MIERASRTIVLAAIAAASLAGCDRQPEPVAPASPMAAAPAAESRPAPGDLAAGDLEHSSVADAQAPFVLDLTVTPLTAKAGETVTVVATINAPRAWAAPATIAIELPAGAKLKSGAARETLAELPAGKTERKLAVTLAADLDERSPISVAVDMRDPGGAFGAHAKKTVPEPTPKARTYPPNMRLPDKTAKPPIARPGM